MSFNSAATALAVVVCFNFCTRALLASFLPRLEAFPPDDAVRAWTAATQHENIIKRLIAAPLRSPKPVARSVGSARGVAGVITGHLQSRFPEHCTGAQVPLDQRAGPGDRSSVPIAT